MFKPTATVGWFYTENNSNFTPKSATHEMLELGQAKNKNYGTIRKKELNFRTYSMNDFRFDHLTAEDTEYQPSTTTYERHFANIVGRKKVPAKAKELIPDKFWNRKPLNDFAIERITSSEYKFMDDHLINVTEQRKKVNFLRQLRNQHHPLA